MSTIRGSSKLLHQLHLLPNPHSLLPIPPRFRTCHMFQVFIEGKVISFISQFDDQVFGTAPNPLKSSAPDTNSGRFHARFHTIESGCLPRVGDTAKAILLCQPPITEMSYSLNCCPRSSSTASIVRAPEGLTVGHLYNSTKELMRAHMLCPHAPAEFLDAQGYVKVEVTYTGKIKLRPDDPHLMGNDSAIQDFRKPLRSAWYFPENPEKLRAYTKVKQAGKLCNLVIVRTSLANVCSACKRILHPNSC